jgi:hypothetical protein
MPTHATLGIDGKVPAAQLPTGQGGITLSDVKADEQIAAAISNTHASGSDNQSLSDLVVKVTGSSLVADTEIAKIHANTSDHAAVSVSAPISLNGQAISIVNDAAGTVTEIDTGALANSDTVIPTSKAVTTAIAAAGGHDPVTISTGNGLSLSTQQLSLGAATNAVPGAATAAQITKLEGIATGANVGVVPNAGIAAGTNTKITYDVKGLVTAGEAATTADIADSNDKRYCTEAQKTALHAAVSVTDPIAKDAGQALSLVNDAAGAITQIDTAALSDLDTDIPTSKAVGTAITTHAALRTGVHGIGSGVVILPQGNPIAESTGAITIHIADMLTGIVTGNPSAARAYTLDTGGNCDAGVTMSNNEAFDWVLININTTAANIITLTSPDASHTIVGSTKVPANSTTTGNLWGTSGATLRTRKTAANTFITYRIG